MPSLATQLALEFGQGFAEKNLHRMIQLADVFPDREIVVTLSRQLGWSHFLAILPLKDPLQRDFYAGTETHTRDGNGDGNEDATSLQRGGNNDVRKRCAKPVCSGPDPSVNYWLTFRGRPSGRTVRSKPRSVTERRKQRRA